MAGLKRVFHRSPMTVFPTKAVDDGRVGRGFRRGRWCGGGSHALPLGPGLRRGDSSGSFRFSVGMMGVWPGMMDLSGAR